MTAYVLAQIQLRWGNQNLQRFNETLSVLVELFARQGVRLRQGLVTQYGGQLYEVWNLYEVDDAEHMNRARQALRAEDEYHRIHPLLAEVVRSEQLRYLTALPYSP